MSEKKSEHVRVAVITLTIETNQAGEFQITPQYEVPREFHILLEGILDRAAQAAAQIAYNTIINPDNWEIKGVC